MAECVVIPLAPREQLRVAAHIGRRLAALDRVSCDRCPEAAVYWAPGVRRCARHAPAERRATASAGIEAIADLRQAIDQPDLMASRVRR
jgi:hypothetical protein